MTDDLLLLALTLTMGVNIYQQWREARDTAVLLRKVDRVLTLMLVWREVLEKPPAEQKAALDKVL